MKKLLISIAILMLAGISAVVLFYPDYSSNGDKDYFIGTIVLEMVNDDGSRIKHFNDNALAKEAMNNTIENVNFNHIGYVMKKTGYDSIINYQEISEGLTLQNENQYLEVVITSFDGVYVNKVLPELATRLVEKGDSAPYFKFIVVEKINIERHPTIASFFTRQIGEEIIVGFFVIVWIIVLGVILSKEMKENQNANL